LVKKSKFVVKKSNFLIIKNREFNQKSEAKGQKSKFSPSILVKIEIIEKIEILQNLNSGKKILWDSMDAIFFDF